ncbi:MAG: glycine cleavage system protein H [Actinomycetota bacterium]
MDHTTGEFRIGRFSAPLDRAYHPSDHTWIRFENEGARIGMDSLGVETAGDLAQLLLLPEGTVVAEGDELGSIEAQKFVGPLRAPISGMIRATNEAAMADPALVMKDPYGEGWLVFLEVGPDADTAHLIQGDRIPAWFESSLEEFRRQGSVAE